MRIPELKKRPSSRKVTSVFGGLDRSPAGRDGYFYDMENMSSDAYPLLSPRKTRKTLMQFGARPSALSGQNGLSWVCENRLLYNGVDQGFDLSDGSKSIVGMGAYLIVFPDGYYINTAKLDDDGVSTDRGSLSAKIDSTNRIFEVYPWVDGIPLDTLIDTIQPPFPRHGQYWVDCSESPIRVRLYSSEAGWQTVPQTHIRLNSDGIENVFDIGDTVELKNFDTCDGFHGVVSKGENCLILDGFVDQCYAVMAGGDNIASVSREIPLLDYVCEYRNRLWGCRYGLNRQGEFVNEIYASSLGNMKNWQSLEGISTDSHTISCGSDGEWTGIAQHLGYLLFFKESRIHKLYGTKPSDFSLSEIICDGAMKGCENAFCNCGETLYFMSKKGVQAFEGGLPECISLPLGRLKPKSARLSSCFDKIHLNFEDVSGAHTHYVYDKKLKMWHREDREQYIFMTRFEGNVLGVRRTGDRYYLDAIDGEALSDGLTELFDDVIEESEPVWSVTTGRIGLAQPDNKYITRIKVRLEARKGTAVTAFVSSDADSIWREAGTLVCSELASYSLPFDAPLCDHMRIKLEGRGRCGIYSLSYYTETVGEGS